MIPPCKIWLVFMVLWRALYHILSYNANKSKENNAKQDSILPASLIEKVKLTYLRKRKDTRPTGRSVVSYLFFVKKMQRYRKTKNGQEVF